MWWWLIVVVQCLMLWRMCLLLAQLVQLQKEWKEDRKDIGQQVDPILGGFSQMFGALKQLDQKEAMSEQELDKLAAETTTAQ